jgi:hypothetical protein
LNVVNSSIKRILLWIIIEDDERVVFTDEFVGALSERPNQVSVTVCVWVQQLHHEPSETRPAS